MLFSEAVKLALQSLWANKLRSILTLIGVVMGVASVIMVITLTNTANDYMGTKITGYGADVFTVDRSGLVFNAEEYFKFQKRKIIKYEDYEAIRDGCTDCKEVGALLSKTTNVVYNGQSSKDTGVRGYTATMFSLNNLNIAIGRALNEADIDHATHSVVVGYDIVDNILGDGDPIGKELRVDGVPYTIVGVAERQGKTFGQSQDNWVAIPLTAYQHTYGTNDSMTVYARANGDSKVMSRAEDEVRVIMRTRRHDAPGAEDSFELQTNDTFLDLWRQISQMFVFIVFALASISLVVGGIVIMNIMLVSVTERTREIGVRKALGARQRDVLLQFLIESGLMATLGGVIGILIGVGVAALITQIFDVTVNVSIGSIFLGMFMATGTGVFFGVYPASKAAKLDPIVALRSEM
ncbi:ABC transporter permease [Acidicapsa acidisoli]|uniref:ABC transporter permease n=1 Tax=Acidicapsa acidisoli TaxID=1615681 RepID=UPI0021DF42F2|nr:ABC transporter permease [Acidicapsa acidisoli]